MALGNWSFSFSTASAVCDGYLSTEIPGIRMELMKSHRYDEVLQAERHSDNYADFPQLLPEILEGKRSDWFLRDVEIKADCLTLTFASRKTPLIQAGSASSYEMYRGAKMQAYRSTRSIKPSELYSGTVKVTNPTVIGLKFTVPPLLGQPEIVYECMMSSSGTGHSHSLQLTEIYADPETKKTVQNNIHFGQSKV